MPLIASQVPRLPSRSPLDHFPYAVREGAECDVVLGIVVRRGQPITIGPPVERNARAAVEIARNGFELEADRAVREIVHAVERGDRVISELLDVIDKILLRGVVK